MGIEYNALQAIHKAKLAGATLKKTATIGRQGQHVSPKTVSFLNLKESDARALDTEIYADKLLKVMGAQTVDSFDFSTYEDATFIHDMNTPISDEYKNKYSLVFDGGSLEHVFNFPVAIKNCMQMVQVGGYFITATVCNNFSGHGFYQFSPELFFRIFTRENGYDLEGVYISENNQWYKVKDPAVIQSRVTFRNNQETYIIVIAKKIANANIFATTPQQSDYVTCWNAGNSEKTETFKAKVLRKLIKLYKRYFITYDTAFFEKLK